MGLLEGFIDEYFVRPLAHPGETAPYNFVNTVVFAVVAIAAAWGVLRILQLLRVKVDWELGKSLVPFILFGGVVRALVDAQVLPRSVNIAGVTAYPFVTPVIYVLVFLFFITSLTAALLLLRRGVAFHFSLRVIGVAALLLSLLPLSPLFKNFTLLALIAVISIA
ncbi:MAG: DUF63 family protein, partial [Candidatus Micrarchaeota archaeon]